MLGRDSSASCAATSSAGPWALRRRSLKDLRSDEGLVASATRSIVAQTVGDMQWFRRELSMALFTLPWLRVLLVPGKAGELAAGETGIRPVHLDTKQLLDFVWPACDAVPGLWSATVGFLGEAQAVHAERLLGVAWTVCQQATVPDHGERMARYRG